MTTTDSKFGTGSHKGAYQITDSFSNRVRVIPQTQGEFVLAGDFTLAFWMKKVQVFGSDEVVISCRNDGGNDVVGNPVGGSGSGVVGITSGWVLYVRANSSGTLGRISMGLMDGAGIKGLGGRTVDYFDCLQ